jgi:predicted nucleic acid-binding protein
MKRVFLDASCWVAAAGSPTGGSSRILELAQAGRIRIVTTRAVLWEAIRSTAENLGDEALRRLYRLLADVDPERVDDPSAEEERCWEELTDAEDLHVLAGAHKAAADVLVSLDRKHILTERVRAGFSILVQDTRQFLTQFAEEQSIEE